MVQKKEFRIWKRLFGPMHLFCGENANNELSDGFVAGVSVGLYVKKRGFLEFSMTFLACSCLSVSRWQ